MLVMSNDDEEIASRGARRGPNNKKKVNPEVKSVCWTMNDLRVVTLQSVPGMSDKIQGTRLKVWDSVTGDLLRMIRTVSSAVTAGVGSVLEPHPLDPAVVITGGEDGIVSVWDIENEDRLFVYQFDGPGMTIYDASFSPDGSRFAVTTSKGCPVVVLS